MKLLNWKLLLACLLGVSLVFTGCELTDEGEEVGIAPEEDTGTPEEDTGTPALPEAYRWVRICPVETYAEWQARTNVTNTGSPGADIDAVEIWRGGSKIQHATQLGPNNIRTQGHGNVAENRYADPNAALGAPDVTSLSHDEEQNWVTIGFRENYLTLGFDQDIAYGDNILVYKVDEQLSSLGDRANDPINVLVSLSSDGQTWVNAGTGQRRAASGRGYVEVEAPVDSGAYMPGCPQ